MTELIGQCVALLAGILGALRAWELFSAWSDS